MKASDSVAELIEKSGRRNVLSERAQQHLRFLRDAESKGLVKKDLYNVSRPQPNNRDARDKAVMLVR